MALKLAMRAKPNTRFKTGSKRVSSLCPNTILAIGTTPHREHEPGDELRGRIAAIAARLRQACGVQRGIETHVIEQALPDCHATPRP